MYTAKELDRLTIAALKDEATRLGLKPKESWTKRILKKKIVAQQAMATVDNPGAEEPGGTLPANPEFEAAAGQTGMATSEPAGRGGARPGAGRRVGQTAEKARMDNLPQRSNPAIRDGLRLAFEKWAAKMEVPELALSEDEAEDLALPYTQLLAYFGIDDHIPVWATLGITATWNTINVLKIRRAILEAKRPDLFQPKPVEPAQAPIVTQQ